MPAWYDEMIPGRISDARGSVAVWFDSATKSGGRRTQAHEFADVDGAWVEDSGGKPHRYPLQLFLVGDNYHVQLQELEDILDRPGPIRLDHPWRGAIENLYLDDSGYTSEESKDQLGKARVSLTLVQVGQPEPLIFEGLRSGVRTRSAAVLVAAAAQFEVYSGQDILGSAQRSLARVGDALTDTYNDVLSKFGPIAEVRNAINSFRDDLAVIASLPNSIVSQFGFVERLLNRLTAQRSNALGRRPVGYAAPLDALRQSADRVRGANSTPEALADKDAVLGASSTGISAVAVLDLDAINVFTAATTLASFCDVLGVLELPDAEAAQSLATYIAEFADSIMGAPIGPGPIAADLYESLLWLKHDAVQLLEQLAGSLPNRATYTVPNAMTVVAAAYAQNGDTGPKLSALLKALFEANSIEDPFALPAGEQLQVVSP